MTFPSGRLSEPWKSVREPRLQLRLCRRWIRAAEWQVTLSVVSRESASKPKAQASDLWPCAERETERTDHTAWLQDVSQAPRLEGDLSPTASILERLESRLHCTPREGKLSVSSGARLCLPFGASRAVHSHPQVARSGGGSQRHA